ncbi:MAG: hypothetical protein QM660_06185 [Dysgonomonas sp.]
MKTVKRLFLLLVFAKIISIPNLWGQVTIGLDQVPQAGALLELRNQPNSIVTSTKGLGLPRVYLESFDDLRPALTGSDATNPNLMKSHMGLMVYNTNDNAPFDVEGAGIYVWGGTTWTKMNEDKTLPGNPTTGGDGMIPPVTNPDLYLPNCYIVGTNSTINVPVKKAFSFWKEYKAPIGATYGFNNNVSNTNISVDIETLLTQPGYSAKAVLLWQSTPGLISNANPLDNTLLLDQATPLGNIQLQTSIGGGDGGNALIAFVVNDGTNDVIYWSWHIWVTDYDPNSDMVLHCNSVRNAEFNFMGRNLGALSNTTNNTKSGGLLYQWGRKDPFTGIYGEATAVNPNTGALESVLFDANGVQHADIIKVDAQTANSLSKSIQNPTTFISGNAGHAYDWYTNQLYTQVGSTSRHFLQNDYLWGNDGGKTPFDPCPQGWKVPSNISGRSPWYYGGYPTNPNDQVALSPDGCFGASTHNITDIGGFNFVDPAYNLGFFSVTGMRDFSTGQLKESTNNGTYWIASASTNHLSTSAPIVLKTTANVWTIKDTSFYPGTSQNRANAYAVRCIKE